MQSRHMATNDHTVHDCVNIENSTVDPSAVDDGHPQEPSKPKYGAAANLSVRRPGSIAQKNHKAIMRALCTQLLKPSVPSPSMVESLPLSLALSSSLFLSFPFSSSLFLSLFLSLPLSCSLFLSLPLSSSLFLSLPLSSSLFLSLPLSSSLFLSLPLSSSRQCN